MLSFIKKRLSNITKKSSTKKKGKKVYRKTAKKVSKGNARKDKKKARVKTAKAVPVKRLPLSEGEIFLGRVTHYFPQVKAGAVLIEKGAVSKGDTLHIKGHTTDFKQKVKSIQIDRAPVQKATKGKEVGILVKSRVRINDEVFVIKS